MMGAAGGALLRFPGKPPPTAIHRCDAGPIDGGAGFESHGDQIVLPLCYGEPITSGRGGGDVKRVEVQVSLRAKHQLTLPDPVARHLGAAPGDRLLITVQEDQPETATLRVLRRSYAGIAGAAYGPAPLPAAPAESGGAPLG